ncbi:MAG: hypothetical protein P4L55_04685 [Syntrophobacteraceae bacterium]|nr:hypothetical protein [Syntrophobacteraceae bacterium]
MEAAKIVGIKYCGGCNPRIDRSRVAEEIGACLPEGFQLVQGKGPVVWDVGILICGCAVACADSCELKSLARGWIRVCGPVVDHEEVVEGRIARAIAEKLSKIALDECL